MPSSTLEYLEERLKAATSLEEEDIINKMIRHWKQLEEQTK